MVYKEAILGEGEISYIMNKRLLNLIESSLNKNTPIHHQINS